MTKPRSKPKTRFHAFLVAPEPNFRPNNWQDKPSNYRIIEYVGSKNFKGRADAWRFLHNHKALDSGEISSWAIYID